MHWHTWLPRFFNFAIAQRGVAQIPECFPRRNPAPRTLSSNQYPHVSDLILHPTLNAVMELHKPICVLVLLQYQACTIVVLLSLRKFSSSKLSSSQLLRVHSWLSNRTVQHAIPKTHKETEYYSTANIAACLFTQPRSNPPKRYLHYLSVRQAAAVHAWGR